MSDGALTRSRIACAPVGPRALFVTGSDGAYHRCLEQLLLSIERVDPKRTVQVMAFDLGWSAAQRGKLVRRFPWVELRSFDLGSQPSFMQIRDRALNSNAWKPQLLELVTSETTLPVLWLDSACVLVRHPERILRQIEEHGFYAPFGGHSSIARWTHPDTAAWFGMEWRDLTQRMRASGVVGVLPSDRRAKALVSRWALACRDARCVAPAGAHRRAHNFDQSVLNLLLLRARAEEGLCLTRDELDISSTQPLAELRTRNKVRPWVPLAFDRLVRAYYAAYLALDVVVLRYRRSPACLPFARDQGAPLPW